MSKGNTERHRRSFDEGVLARGGSNRASRESLRQGTTGTFDNRRYTNKLEKIDESKVATKKERSESNRVSSKAGINEKVKWLQKRNLVRMTIF